MLSVETAASAACIIAALMFVLALAGLAKHETSRAGDAFGITGMVVAMAATVALAVDRGIDSMGIALVIGAVAIGAVIGLWRARVVEMTAMPELIALLHSFVGLAAVVVGWNGYLHIERYPHNSDAESLDAAGLLGIHAAEVVIGVLIGAVTFTGSIVANLKLSARIDTKPVMLPGKNASTSARSRSSWSSACRSSSTRTHGRSVPSPVSRSCSAGTWSPRSEVVTCLSWSRC